MLFYKLICFVILYFPGIFRPWETSPKKTQPTSPLPVLPRYTEPVTPPGVKPSSPAACDSGYYSNSPSTSPVPSGDQRSAPVDYNTIPVYATECYVSASTQPSPCKVQEPKTRTLNTRALEMMEVWYYDNIGHPYPSTEILDYICKHGNVTTTQVRKWMANKRNRSCNTLTYNSTIHPKRLKRLQRDVSHQKPRHHPYGHRTPTKQRQDLYSHGTPTNQHQPQYRSSTGTTVPVPVQQLHGLSAHHLNPYMMPAPYFIQHLMPTSNFMLSHAQVASK